jgi:prepilin-type N-terminal cleavage/methylation domain-containing protein
VRKLPGEHGFTLVESLIASALLAGALLSIGHLSSGAIALQAQARNRTLSTMLAVAKLEELRASMAPTAGSDIVDAAGEPVRRDSSRQFERHWSVTPLSPRASILSVQVTPTPRGLTGLPVRITGGWMVVRR